MATAEERYRAAAHAMQSGVAMEMQQAGREAATQPKDLRVGVNAAMVDHAGLVRLLIAKGIISEAEYLDAIAGAMEDEQARYEARISAALGGVKITLG